MKNSRWARVIVLGSVVALVPAMARAQSTRTWVSGVGADENPCSRTAPCKTFAGAISKTLAGGEINVLDSGGFGGLTITQPVTIRSVGLEAGVLIAGTNGIVVNTPGANDVVILEGLDIFNASGNFDGVRILKGNVTIRKCSIAHFGGSAVSVLPTTSPARVLIQDSNIFDSNYGVKVGVVGGAIAATAVIERTTIDSNPSAAVQVNSNSTLYLSASSLQGIWTKVQLNSFSASYYSFGNNIIVGVSASPTPIGMQ